MQLFKTNNIGFHVGVALETKMRILFFNFITQNLKTI